LHNVLKPSNINYAKEPVAIPDAVFTKSESEEEMQMDISGVEIDLSAYSDEDKRSLEEYFERKKKTILSSIRSEKMELEQLAQSISDDAQKKAAAIVENAEAKAEASINNAEREASRIISDANDRAEQICEEAQKRGFEEGLSRKAQEIDECIAQQKDFMVALKNAQEEKFEEIYSELKYFALDIAEKIVYKKIEDDGEFLGQLVMQALKDFKSAEWVNVEISDQMTQLAEYLENQQKAGAIPQEAKISTSNTESGTIVLESESAIADVSIDTQINNIKGYFDSYGEEYETEPGDNSAQT